MDSAINAVLWEKSSLPILADVWVDDNDSEDQNLLEQFEAKLHWQMKKELAKKTKKLKWEPNPMEL